MKTADVIIIGTYVIGFLLAFSISLTVRKKLVHDKGPQWELDADDWGMSVLLGFFWPLVVAGAILFLPVYGIYRLVDFVSDKLLWAYKEATNPKENV